MKEEKTTKEDQATKQEYTKIVINAGLQNQTFQEVYKAAEPFTKTPQLYIFLQLYIFYSY